MITKTHEENLGFGPPEKQKKKKKKKVVKEPETQYSVLNSDSDSSEVCPPRAIAPSKSGVQGQAAKMPLVKQKKKKKGHSTVCREPPDAETTACARQTEESPGPGKQPRGPSESLCREKKNKKTLWSLASSPGSRVKTSPDPRQGEAGTGVGKKLKKHKKEKKAPEAAASAQGSWFCEAGDALHACSAGKGGQELAALGQKRKQGSPREPNAKLKKKKKIHQEGDTPRGHPEPSRSVESSPRKGSKKKPVRVEASEYSPVGDGPRAPAKKKTKSKKEAELPGTEEPALRKRKKRKESRVELSEEVGFPSDVGSALGGEGGQLGACVCVCARSSTF